MNNRTKKIMTIVGVIVLAVVGVVLAVGPNQAVATLISLPATLAATLTNLPATFIAQPQ